MKPQQHRWFPLAIFWIAAPVLFVIGDVIVDHLPRWEAPWPLDLLLCLAAGALALFVVSLFIPSPD